MSCRLINNMKLHNLAHHITVLQPMICLHLQHFPQYFRKYKTWLFWHNIKVKVHGNYNCFALLPPLKNLKLAATLLQPLPTITTAHVMEGGWNFGRINSVGGALVCVLSLFVCFTLVQRDLGDRFLGWDRCCEGGGPHWNPHLSRHFKTFFFCFQDYKISWWKGKKTIGWSGKTQKMEFYFYFIFFVKSLYYVLKPA